MLTLKQVQETGRCVFCNRDKEVITVVMEGQPGGEVQLCWTDLRKMAHMRMRLGGTKPNPSTPGVPVTK